jgi:hypothetical protein
MRTIIEDALFLKSEKKEFTNAKEEKISYEKVTFLDGENNYVEATIDTKISGDEGFEYPGAREECSIDYEVTEETGARGKYLKKKVWGITV